ncbi:uncharacterized protein DUF4913 [Kribbella amoyensis]|uniref:Uncharacterized protein DUF4913 n=1 Tax=Kribbella amoyensis TaxID=996641 RepID=A0A561BZR8_9ACTN|nr:DUF4913 domain-containing protein [Kribbella amoyensis]TWD84172.1 uncharacterized protein DUF4913 [Kribbella amoyensis]
MDDEPIDLFYPHLGAFVSEWIARRYARRLGNAFVWCPEWYQHSEAMSRLDALWRAWESLRHDGQLGMSLWWRDHADHHMTYLLDPDGPFGTCRSGHSEFPVPDLPLVDPPEGLFVDLRQPALSA